MSLGLGLGITDLSVLGDTVDLWSQFTGQRQHFLFPGSAKLPLLRCSPSEFRIVAGINDKLYINDGSNKTVTLTAGDYLTPQGLAEHATTQLNASSSGWSVTYDADREGYLFARSSGTAQLKFATTTQSCARTFGFDDTDKTGAAFYRSTYRIARFYHVNGDSHVLDCASPAQGTTAAPSVANRVIELGMLGVRTPAFNASDVESMIAPATRIALAFKFRIDGNLMLGGGAGDCFFGVQFGSRGVDAPWSGALANGPLLQARFYLKSPQQAALHYGDADAVPSESTVSCAEQIVNPGQEDEYTIWSGGFWNNYVMQAIVDWHFLQGVCTLSVEGSGPTAQVLYPRRTLTVSSGLPGGAFSWLDQPVVSFVMNTGSNACGRQAAFSNVLLIAE